MWFLSSMVEFQSWDPRNNDSVMWNLWFERNQWAFDGIKSLAYVIKAYFADTVWLDACPRWHSFYVFCWFYWFTTVFYVICIGQVHTLGVCPFFFFLIIFLLLYIYIMIVSSSPTQWTKPRANEKRIHKINWPQNWKLL